MRLFVVLIAKTASFYSVGRQRGGQKWQRKQAVRRELVEAAIASVAFSVGKNRLEAFKMRFRRSGSIGMPFVSIDSRNMKVGVELPAYNRPKLRPSQQPAAEVSGDAAALDRHNANSAEAADGPIFLAVIVEIDKSSQAMRDMMAAMPVSRQAASESQAASLQIGTIVKHIESRDPRSARLNSESSIEVFVEVELRDASLVAGLLSSLREGGFIVNEVSQTQIPPGAEEFRDAGSEGGRGGGVGAQTAAGCPL